jgi:hypothetical protein
MLQGRSRRHHGDSQSITRTCSISRRHATAIELQRKGGVYLVVTTEDHALSVRLPNDLYEKLRRTAFEQRTSQADIVRQALTEYLKEKR